MKQSVESVLGTENVVIDIQQMSSDELNNISYFANTAAQKDYDLYNGGWSGDYQDPSTYLDTLNTKKARTSIEKPDSFLIENSYLFVLNMCLFSLHIDYILV